MSAISREPGYKIFRAFAYYMLLAVVQVIYKRYVLEKKEQLNTSGNRIFVAG
jgi:hypothetical protein